MYGNTKLAIMPNVPGNIANKKVMPLVRILIYKHHNQCTNQIPWLYDGKRNCEDTLLQNSFVVKQDPSFLEQIPQIWYGKPTMLYHNT